MAPDHVVLAQDVVTLNTQRPQLLPKSGQSQSVFSEPELRPANRSVFLTFKDPDHTTVDIVEMIDVNNGIPSMQNPFKIPIRPKLGIWTIEASYSDDYTTTAKTNFEVKEYVLPSFSILMEPEVNYISYGQFNRFSFKLSARYLHGAPVADGEVLLRYGYISGKDPPVIIPSVTTHRREHGEASVQTQQDLNSLEGKYLYIAVLVEEATGGLSQEAEFASVKFVKSPYSLRLVSTPLFIKPGLPYSVQVLVKDHLGKPVSQVRVRLVKRQLFMNGMENEEMPCPDSANSQSDGLAVFICNTPRNGFETEDSALPAASQASLSLEAVAYESPNQRYLYIDPPLPGQGLEVGRFASIKVYSATPSYIPVNSLNYVVISKGKVVDFRSQKFLASTDNKQVLSFRLTPVMVPSIRLLVYYILFGEGTSELVADSVWLEVKDKCVNGLKTDLSYRSREYKPKENIQLDIQTNQDGLLALSAVDTALYTYGLTTGTPLPWLCGPSRKVTWAAVEAVAETAQMSSDWPGLTFMPMPMPSINQQYVNQPIRR
ncbi:Complement C5 Hemolytic complement Complement C5 beta chain [Larimichthys crocea]|uniref:Complement C5 Hemolytic complement Complement C5 beta chain n=1 Tax=Larimichthys crocea TaxID=215358 RepID=A0A6G0IM23_LARCR|nr:Complement C5 Hemolytic complement Complement C5 beta chain [Larimichthys crocea]